MNHQEKAESMISEMQEDNDFTGLDEISQESTLSLRKRMQHKRKSRSKTIAPKRLTKEELRQSALLSSIDDSERPTIRKECMGSARPCPWVSCKHHLYLDVNPETGSIKLNFPHLNVWEMNHTCSLDVADKGGTTLEEVGTILNLTRERIRQVEVRGLTKLKMVSPEKDFS